MKSSLSSSMEDYLEAIYNLMLSEGKVRITDLSETLNVKKSSANSAIQKLKNLNMVNHERYENIKLTSLGEQEAKKIKAKHDMLLKFLADFLGVPVNQAMKDACKIEHAISNITFERLSKFIDFINQSPNFSTKQWQKSFNNYIETGNLEGLLDIH
ncbi:MAG: metal-dependent transcriptional regulator [Spirochaetes bacterium]|nr:metal-dependent transcriptional regulator [Spirochaetota bacterium]